jgi:hypothetical protein
MKTASRMALQALFALSCGTRVKVRVLLGVAICILTETVFIQIVNLFFHVFCMYSVLLSTDLRYSHVPED